MITYPDSMKREFFEAPSYIGIKLFTSEGTYQVINNFYMGPRIIITMKDGFWNDIPFKPDTFYFLPESVSAIPLEDFSLPNNDLKK